MVSFRMVCPSRVHFLVSISFLLVCPPGKFFVCELVLPFNFENASETFVYECLESTCWWCLTAIEQHTFHIGDDDSYFIYF